MIEGKPKQETVEITAQVLGISLARAREIIAIETKETDGDQVALPPTEADGSERELRRS